MIEVVGRGACSEDEAVHLRAIHEEGTPTGTAIFPRGDFQTFLSKGLRLEPESEPIFLWGRRSIGANAVALRISRPNPAHLRMAIIDASGKSVNSTDFLVSAWTQWSIAPRPEPGASKSA